MPNPCGKKEAYLASPVFSLSYNAIYFMHSRKAEWQVGAEDQQQRIPLTVRFQYSDFLYFSKFTAVTGIAPCNVIHAQSKKLIP